jgi:hypothetical protein
MTTILIFNAVSSLVAVAGIGGLAARRAARAAKVQPVYVTTGTRRRRAR